MIKTPSKKAKLAAGRELLSPDERAFAGEQKDYSLTLAKGIAVLEMFSVEIQNVSLQNAADHLGTSRASARRLLMTLNALGYLEKTHNGYRLTPRCLSISRALLSGTSIIEVFTEKTRVLSAEIDCPCSIVSMFGSDVMFICRDPSRRVFASQLSIGDRLPAHASAGGKLLLAQMAPKDITRWFKQYNPTKLTDSTITSSSDMISLATDIRSKGYATSCGELEPGLISLAVPITDHLSSINHALVVSQFAAKTSQSEMVNSLLKRVKQSAEEISQLYADYLLHQS